MEAAVFVMYSVLEDLRGTEGFLRRLFRDQTYIAVTLDTKFLVVVVVIVIVVVVVVIAAAAAAVGGCCYEGLSNCLLTRPYYFQSIQTVSAFLLKASITMAVCTF